MELVWHLFIVAGMIYLMSQAAEKFIYFSSNIAKRFNISDLVIGLTFVSMGTSAPEMVVSSIAAWNGRGGLAVSNVIGSNIFNIGIILGIVAIVHRIKIGKMAVYRDGAMLFASAVALFIFMLDGVLSRSEGAIFIIALVGYISYLLFSKSGKVELPEDTHIGEWYDFFLAPVAALALFGTGKIMVGSAITVATILGMSDWLIGLTVVAAGTSMPEMITSFTAMKHGKTEMSIGNLLGSDVFNVLAILGISAIIHPLTPVDINLPINLAIFSGVILMTILLMRRRFVLGVREGMLLVGVGVIRIGLAVFGLL